MAQLSKSRVKTDNSHLSTEHFRAIKSLLYDTAGIKLADHKRQMVENRIAKRIAQLSLNSFGDYVDYLGSKGNRDEIVHLVNALTTNVTHFFRENHHFDHLKMQIETLLQNKAYKIRIWSAGCSIGAEPYSAAISTYETMRKAGRNCDARILATDIDTLALARARKGQFHEKIIKGLSRSHLLENFDVRNDGDEKIFKIKDHVRKMVSYNYLNFNDRAWPMKGPFDFIFCRNALIYFDREKQDEYVGKMVHLLKPNGFLYLGHSEHSVMEGKGFKICGQTIYQKV